MRIAMAFIVVALLGCTGSDELDPDDQGACSNLAADVCRASERCQLAYRDDAFRPEPTVMHCLDLGEGEASANACPQDHDACRARPDCSPVFWQKLDGTDMSVGDPTYQRCVTELDFADLYAPTDAACEQLMEGSCRANASCQPLFVINPHAAGPRFLRCLGLSTVIGGSFDSCPQDHLSCRARPDCAPMFMQDVGPNDASVGEPYYLRCDTEASVGLEP